MATELPILLSCARPELSTIHREILVSRCHSQIDWGQLLDLAEVHGLAPLLYKHLTMLDIDLPLDFLRSLRMLCLRHRQANELIMRAVRRILILLGKEGVKILVLKGAALCQTIYPQVGLRPMRDVDLLLAGSDAERAHEFLQQYGLSVSNGVVPDDHYHLIPLHMNVEGFQVSIELHHALYPNIPPYNRSRPFNELYANSRIFDIEGMEARTLSLEDMLDHLYHQGFHTPLIHEPYRLISVADIIGLVEKEAKTIDWQKIQTDYPHLFSALPSFHYLSPFVKEVLDKIPKPKQNPPDSVGEPFVGWPRLRIAQLKEKGVVEIIRRTFFPGQWWFEMYYTPSNRLDSIRISLIRHPRHIYWWVKLFWDIFLETHLPPGCKDERGVRSKWRIIQHIKRLAVAMYRKF